MLLVPIPGALPYIAGELTRGRGLARLASNIDLSDGAVCAFLPEKSAVELAGSFDTGSLVAASDRGRAVDEVAGFLKEDLGLLSDRHMALVTQFADSPTRRQDPPPSQPFSRLWLEGSPNAYEDGELWFTDDRHDEKAVSVMLTESLWYPALAVLVSPPSALQHNTTVEANDLAEWMSPPRALLCGAWDATNYLIWTSAAG